MRLPRLLWSLSLAAELLAQSPVSSTTTLIAAPESSTLSQTVTLTAVVSPPPPTGKVTFSDGATILGISSVVAGAATLATRLLSSGTRSLQARYWGDATFASSASNVVPLTVTAFPSASFTPAPFSPFPVATDLDQSTVGDFNGDGKLDLAVLSRSGQGLTVWLGDGNGGFQPLPQSSAQRNISGATITVSDLNGDGNQDLAIPNSFAGNLTLLLGDGRGGFAPAPGSPIKVGMFPYQVAVSDFNGDGRPDLAVNNQISSSGPGTVSILLGDGNGRFSEVPGSPFVAGPPSSSSLAIGAVAGDFNRDGTVDLAVVNHDAVGSVAILLNDGTGAFRPPLNFPAGMCSSGLDIGDLNRDGNLDVVVGSDCDSHVTILLGDGSGGLTLASGSPVEVGASPRTLALADFNADGNLDLITANYSSSDVTILLGAGDGAFAPAPYSPVPMGTVPLLMVGDFNRDGLLDFATANYLDGTVSVMMATPGLATSVTQAGVFAVNQLGTYSLTVKNISPAQGSGPVTLTDTLPSGLKPQTATGDGWACSISGQTVTCTREDPLPAESSYPAVDVSLTVDGGACPNVVNSVGVSTASSPARVTASIRTPVSGCVTVTRQPGSLIVGKNGSYTLTATPVAGTSPSGGLTLTDTLPIGLVPKVASGSGWNCNINATTQVVFCTWPPGLPPVGAYPPVTISVNPTIAACPSTTNVVQAQLDGAQLDFFPNDIDVHGCLSVPSAVPLPDILVGSLQLYVLTVRSLDSQLLQINSQLTQAAGGQFSVVAGCPTLASYSTCQMIVQFGACLGQQSATLLLNTDAGASYPVALNLLGLVGTVSFALDGKPVSSGATLNPAEPHTASLTLSPPLNASCQPPSIALGFSPPAVDASSYDVKFNAANNQLNTGTVAGTITLKAQVGGVDIVPQNGPGSVQLQIPAQAGVLQSATIGKKTSSSFEITVKGYSTPRETGPSATTQVCFSFSPAAGTNLPSNMPFCALQQDIEIWYERQVSYATGSQFQGSVNVSYSGDTKAIGQIKSWIRNRVGDSAPYCLDFQTGAQQACK